ncbi:MAG: flagellar basal body rod protein FlgB [Candidatus Sericytochromatia bacterium]|nr:flagellar basal body rod protein FlgB [Candidatus Sericytochromatia bacterium]
MLEGLFGKKTAIFEAALHGLQERGEAIAENLANVDTPGYKARRVAFEEQLRFVRGQRPAELAATTPAHFRLGPKSAYEVRPAETRDGSSTLRNDGNNVDIDVEMTALAKNQISYNYAAELTKRQFEGLKSVIRGS